jgi:hypothetical protein
MMGGRSLSAAGGSHADPGRRLPVRAIGLGLSVLLAAAVAAALGATGCSDDRSQPVVSLSGLGSGAAAGPGVDALMKSWGDAKLQVSAFAPVDGKAYAGGTCQAGTVSGVDTVLCSYPDAKAAKAAEAAGLAAIGETTGSSLSRDNLLLVVSDPRKADPSGRTINAVTKSFLGR